MKSPKANSRLAGVLQDRMMEVSNYAASQGPELGTITGSMGLKLDAFQFEIPRGDYKVCRTLALKDGSTETAGDPSHKHSVNISAMIPNLAAGNRVLVVWASGEPVVVDVIV